MPHSEPGPGSPHHDSSAKETVISIIIAFVVAFVFRGFVLEPFLIPTGSMAPTLMGAHMRFRGPDTGYTWPVGPWSFLDNNQQNPTALQRDPRTGPPGGDIVVNDPMSRELLRDRDVRTRSGDRIFVLKSLYNVLDPARFDVIVFKNPSIPQENYIKRLIGLPGEQVALIDGDVFARPMAGAVSASTAAPETWDQDGWRIARKPERVQRAAWQAVFDTDYTPLSWLNGESRAFRSPWKGSTPGWEIEGRKSYAYSGTAPTSLVWDGSPWDTRAGSITDFYPYNQAGKYDQTRVFNVSDVRLLVAVKPSSADQKIQVTVGARNHEFRAEIAGTGVTISQRETDPRGGAPGAWSSLGEGLLRDPLRTDRFSAVEVWHVDQSVQVWVEGKLVARADYDWTPSQRVRATFGMSVAEVLARRPRDERTAGFADPSLYRPCEIRVDFSGGPVELSRTALWRDLHYQAGYKGIEQPASATDPRSTPTLGPDHFFVCGDNSPASLDARLWISVDPWVAEQVDRTVGVVHRDLLVGKAFFVYFPAPVPTRKLWLPDFGRLRFIW